MKAYSIKAGDVILVPAEPEKQLDSVWESVWDITEKKGDKRIVGKVWFSGVPERGVINLEYDILPRFRETEYARDMLRELVDWVFAHRGVYEITTVVSTDDDIKIDNLERSGFVLRIANKTDEHYSIVKPRTVWTGLYIFIGFTAGLMIGLVINSVILGMAIGLVLGILIGTAMDYGAKSKRTEVTGEKKPVHRKPIINVVEGDSVEEDLTKDEPSSKEDE